VVALEGWSDDRCYRGWAVGDGWGFYMSKKKEC
jgi:hypothetical protein